MPYLISSIDPFFTLLQVFSAAPPPRRRRPPPACLRPGRGLTSLHRPPPDLRGPSSRAKAPICSIPEHHLGRDLRRLPDLPSGHPSSGRSFQTIGDVEGDVSPTFRPPGSLWNSSSAHFRPTPVTGRQALRRTAAALRLLLHQRSVSDRWPLTRRGPVSAPVGAYVSHSGSLFAHAAAHVS